MNLLQAIRRIYRTFCPLLPRRPSKLIRLALKHFESATRDPDIVIDMSWWHRTLNDGKCCVCLAGAVMHYGLHGPARDSPNDYDGDTYSALHAINTFRLGLVGTGCELLGVESGLKMRRIPQPTKGNYAEFVGAMHKLADDLEAEGN